MGCMTDTATIRSYDLFTPEAMSDPMALLRRIREEGPVGWSPQLHAYVLTRYADIVAALKDRRLANANLTRGFDLLGPAEREELRPLIESVRLWMGHTNPADHVRMQQLLKRYFTPATVDALRPQVRQITHDLLDAVVPAGRMDVVTELAYPLPANVIANMLGMPTADRPRLQAWSRDIAAVFQIADIEALRRARQSTLEMQEYLRPLIEHRRTHPSDDIITVLVEAERDGTVKAEEIAPNCVLLLFAGHETTAGLIGNGLALLLAHPDQLALLRERPELTPSAVEEMLRYEGPASAVMRISEQPVEIAGHSFPAGTQFHLAMQAGNRDPEVFPDPERFDITRTGNRHTAFGLGAFYCLGVALARMEADECFRILLDRLPGIRPAYDTLDRESDSPMGRRLLRLPVEW
jgi:cytochrome P450